MQNGPGLIGEDDALLWNKTRHFGCRADPTAQSPEKEKAFFLPPDLPLSFAQSAARSLVAVGPQQQMSCLVPQLRCPNDFHPRLFCQAQVKARNFVCFRSYCVSSPMTAVIDIEKLWKLEEQLTSLAAMRPLTYVGAIGLPAKTNFDQTFHTETLLTCEEAEIAAAAAGAVALARAAVEVTENAAQMIGNYPSVKLENSDDFTSEAELFQLERIRLGEGESVGSINDSGTPETTTHDTEISVCKHELQQMKHFNSTTVRSGRQTERRARRSRATEKAAANVIAVKSGSSSRKKRSSLHKIDYSGPLHNLKGTTSTSKLLTATEELELSEGIQEQLKLERLREELAERNGGQPTFPQWAEAAGVDQKTLRKRLNYGIFCKDKMVKSNIRLVISIAKKYQGVGMNLQDLVQEGCRGLLKGTDKFDASKGFKFSTYAHSCIEQAVRKSLSDQSRTIRLPSRMVDATYRVREARKQLYMEKGRHPDNEEVAEATGLSMKRLTAVMLTPKAPRSLDQKVGINQSLKPSELIADPDAQTTEEILLQQFMKQDLERALDSLSLREKQVVRLRFGLEDGRMKTLQEIGESMGLCRERIRQIESHAFRKLKNRKRTENLRQYVFS